jgi:predicted alpha/beta hydrolase family esterase
VLLLPGWKDSGPGHWQSRWESLHGFTRVVQHDWMRPLRGDWSARLEEVLFATAGPRTPATLVAHSLGCVLVAHWAAHSRHTAWVGAALLVAPPDLERPDVAARIPGWTPLPRAALPFPAVAVISQDDPFSTAERSAALVADWGVACIRAGARVHLNAESGLGEWPAGLGLLAALWAGQTATAAATACAPAILADGVAAAT